VFVFRNAAKAQRGVVAALREILQLAGCETELNRKLNVQECDATMLNKDLSPGK
jgi:hypothetical protein